MAVLQVLKGLNPGQLFPIEGEQLILGRHPECDVVLDMGAVSRQHAQILRIGEDFYIEDLHSRNGTYVNGQLIQGRHRLEENDRLKLCDLLLTFHRGQPGGPAPPTVRIDKASTSVKLVDDDADEGAGSHIMSQLDLSPDEAGLRLSVKPEVKLRAMIEISQSLGRALSLDEVLPKILEGLFKIFAQADRGFVVFRTPDQALVPKAIKHRRDAADDTIRISRTIVRKAMESRQAILSADAATDSRFDMSQSIADFQIRSMMCAPLIASDGEPLGVIQLDTADQRARFRQDDLDVLASVAHQAALAIENADLHERTLKQQAIEHDLELAHKVQRGFLPAAPPRIDGYEFFDYYAPARWLGGDYYDYVELPGKRLAVVLADVSGKGIPAALLAAKLSAEIRYCLASEPDPQRAIRRLNHSFLQSGWEDRFVTLVLGVVDEQEHALTLVNAGHMAPLVRRADGRVEPLGEDVAGLPVGVDGDYPYRQVTVPLVPREIVTLYTDGISEAMNVDGALYGIRRLTERLSEDAATAAELGRRVLDDVQRFLGRQPQSDDMCLACFGRTDTDREVI